MTEFEPFAKIPRLRRDCVIVPKLYEGMFSDDAIDGAIRRLRDNVSVAAPGFAQPEGVVFHLASRTLHKVTLDSDHAKGVVES